MYVDFFLSLRAHVGRRYSPRRGEDGPAAGSAQVHADELENVSTMYPSWPRFSRFCRACRSNCFYFLRHVIMSVSSRIPKIAVRLIIGFFDS